MGTPKKDLIKLFNVEGLVTPRTLTTENRDDVMRKTANQMTLDVKALMEEINYKVVDGDIDGIIACLKASQLRVECMQEVANRLKDMMGPKKSG